MNMRTLLSVASLLMLTACAERTPMEPTDPDPSRNAETLTVPSDGTRVSTTRSYSAGSVVEVQVSGTYKWGGCDPESCPRSNPCGNVRYGDGGFLTDDCWATAYQTFASTAISLFANGQPIEWGPARADHVYSVRMRVSGGPISFTLNDCEGCYVDNEGQLTVTVEPVD